MSRQYFNLTKQSLDNLDKILATIEKSDSLAEIAKAEVAVRKETERVMFYAAMVPSKDADISAYNRRKAIREGSLSAADRVKQIIAEKTERPVKKPAKRGKKLLPRKAKSNGGR